MLYLVARFQWIIRDTKWGQLQEWSAISKILVSYFSIKVPPFVKWASDKFFCLLIFLFNFPRTLGFITTYTPSTLAIILFKTILVLITNNSFVKWTFSWLHICIDTTSLNGTNRLFKAYSKLYQWVNWCQLTWYQIAFYHWSKT